MKNSYVIKYVLLLISLLLIPSCKFFHDEKAHPLNGEQTARLISKFYSELGPRIGAHLVDPNVVITIAGLRGHGNFLMHNLTSDEKLKLEKINETSQKSGIKFILHDDPTDELSDISIINFKGMENTSKLSRLSFITPFDSSTGYEGFLSWLKESRHKAESYFQDKASFHKEALDHLIIGLERGYPDQALLDLYNAYLKYTDFPKNIFNLFKLTRIPYSDFYDNAQPNFHYLAEHENEKSIAATKQTWGDLLTDFYNAPWHKAIANDPGFVKIRASEDKEHNDWFKQTVLNKPNPS